ncbi:hypothetical protein PMI06_009804 [Burkholderia sp. BT03]|nr:hypothetical protein PMI06_009804 [Burkholderia sp. BT03]SKD08404.1 hypothetical protein SAMN06266956_10334 [Paraburkholderia hospita]
MLATLTPTAPAPSPTLLWLAVHRKDLLASLFTIYNAVFQSQQDCRVVRVTALALQPSLQHAVNDVAGDSVFYCPARNGDSTPVELCAYLFQCFQCHAVARILIG